MQNFCFTKFTNDLLSCEFVFAHIFFFFDPNLIIGSLFWGQVNITWDDNSDPDPINTNGFKNEVYYVRLNESQGFDNFKNVTELGSPSQGGRPKVTVAVNKACVAFVGGPGALGAISSRDLNLDNGTWDSSTQ